MKPCCKYCFDCKQEGRQNTTAKGIGRKRYFCRHEKVKDIKDKQGYPLYSFIGFGTSTWESPLTVKTSPRWCPKRNE